MKEPCFGCPGTEFGSDKACYPARGTWYWLQRTPEARLSAGDPGQWVLPPRGLQGPVSSCAARHVQPTQVSTARGQGALHLQLLLPGWATQTQLGHLQHPASPREPRTSPPAFPPTTAPGFLGESYNITHLRGSGTLLLINSLRHQYTTGDPYTPGTGMMCCFDQRENLRPWLGHYTYGLALGLERAELN